MSLLYWVPTLLCTAGAAIFAWLWRNERDRYDGLTVDYGLIRAERDRLEYEIQIMRDYRRELQRRYDQVINDYETRKQVCARTLREVALAGEGNYHVVHAVRDAIDGLFMPPPTPRPSGDTRRKAGVLPPSAHSRAKTDRDPTR